MARRKMMCVRLGSAGLGMVMRVVRRAVGSQPTHTHTHSFRPSHSCAQACTNYPTLAIHTTTPLLPSPPPLPYSALPPWLPASQSGRPGGGACSLSISDAITSVSLLFHLAQSWKPDHLFFFFDVAHLMHACWIASHDRKWPLAMTWNLFRCMVSFLHLFLAVVMAESG
ncbi:hypothetical protein B0T19DRAFT_243563 [Cercophora scortea]|uniref:Uncharacterized protein n=1 Tax=Cercophora scortea TaxID=314031 RepID=A0AAE0I8S4_9PEZI|nr:hypothetical protein B0T19DRAFT_243563 [Cercophora scortea]